MICTFSQVVLISGREKSTLCTTAVEEIMLSAFSRGGNFIKIECIWCSAGQISKFCVRLMDKTRLGWNKAISMTEQLCPSDNREPYCGPFIEQRNDSLSASKEIVASQISCSMKGF